MKETRPYILFVDDEELARRSFTRIASKDFNVVVAGDVKEAISVLENSSEEIGILLTDQRMPGQLGVDLLEHCREHYPHIVRMLTTAYSELDDAIAAVNRGQIIRYIEKPWGNIDGILMDLKLASTLYEVRKDKQTLLDEKISASAKLARQEKLRSLITISAGLPTRNNLLAIELLLRQLSAIGNEEPQPDTAPNLASRNLFGNALENTVNAIQISELVKGIDWSGLFMESASCDQDRLQAADNALRELGLPDHIISTLSLDCRYGLDLAIGHGEQYFEAECPALVSVDTQNNTIAIGLKPADEKGCGAAKKWLNRADVTAKEVGAIGHLLVSVAVISHLGGRFELVFDESGDMSQLAFMVPLESPAIVANDHKESNFDWIDDVMILFA